MKPDRELVGWYYKRGEQHVGPLPIEEVARLLATGQLRPTDMLIEIAEMRGDAGPGVRYSYLDAASAVERDVASKNSQAPAAH
jgi:hypothetical protein